MSKKELHQSYIKNKNKFHEYIKNIKKKTKPNLYTIINPTLIKNTYSSNFPKNFFLYKLNDSDKKFFILRLIKFYFKNFYYLMQYFKSFITYIFFLEKKEKMKLALF